MDPDKKIGSGADACPDRGVLPVNHGRGFPDKAH